jgi:hypothetical protein
VILPGIGVHLPRRGFFSLLGFVAHQGALGREMERIARDKFSPVRE